MTKTLFEPVRFRSGAVAAHRVALAPLTNQQSPDGGVLSPEEERWLLRRAQGGFALVETCAAWVAEDGVGFDGQLGIGREEHVPRLAELARGLRERGALGLVQLYHGGARAPSRLIGGQPWSASAVAEDRPGLESPREGSVQEIERVVVRFAEAASRAARAGFAGVELHAAHGYLLSQFLSREQNVRTDGWGGDLDGRFRLLREVYDAVRAHTPAGFLVGVRLSPEDYGLSRGLHLDDSLEVARRLGERGVDFLHLSLWDATRTTKARPDAHPVPLFRDVLPRDVVVVAAGKVWTRDDALRLVDLGADVVALGRAAILNPDWPILARSEVFAPKRPPATPEELAELAVSPAFVTYLRRFPGFVTPQAE